PKKESTKPMDTIPPKEWLQTETATPEEISQKQHQHEDMKTESYAAAAGFWVILVGVCALILFGCFIYVRYLKHCRENKQQSHVADGGSRPPMFQESTKPQDH